VSKKSKFVSTISLLFCMLILMVGCTPKKKGASIKATIHYTRWATAQEAIDFTMLVNKFMGKYPDITVESEFLPWAA